MNRYEVDPTASMAELFHLQRRGIHSVTGPGDIVIDCGLGAVKATMGTASG